MNSHKRNRAYRAFNHGYRAGMTGKSREKCPYESIIELRASWLGGWRQGRDEFVWGAASSGAQTG